MAAEERQRFWRDMMRPNPSIERTCYTGLLPPWHAAHVER